MVVRFDGVRDQSGAAGKLAEGALHFNAGPLAGLKLVGFQVWEKRSPNGRRNVTFPARTYSVNGERRSFALLRPVEDVDAQERLRDLVLAAFEAHEARDVGPVMTPAELVGAVGYLSAREG